MIVYGIKNCNTVQKALTWLNEHAIEYTFHDYKKEGISKEKLEAWVSEKDWEILINKKGTTWRNLTGSEKEAVTNSDSAIALMHEKTSVIKRPVVEADGNILVGFDENVYASLLK
jgi:arsenate reductase